MFSTLSLSPAATPPLPTKPTSQSPPIHPQLTPSTFTTPFELKQIHANLIKTNTPITTSVLPFPLIASVCAATLSSFSYATRIFHLSDTPPVISWNTHLKSISEHGDAQQAMSLLDLMLKSGVQPDRFTMSFMMKSCVNEEEVGIGRVIHGMILRLGFGLDVYLMNNVMHLYSVCRRSDDARKVFDGMSVRDDVSWNMMVTMLVREGDVDGAYEVFRAIPERNVRSWTSMIAGYVQCGRPRDAVEVFREMEGEGLRPSEVTVVAVLAACADLGELELGRRVHQYSSVCGYEWNVRICNTAIDMYAKCGCLDDARRVFDGMEGRTIVSWSAMIAALAMHGQAEEALRLFYEMTMSGIKPNFVTFIGLLHACSHMGLVDHGREFFHSMSKDYGIVPRIEHYGCMVDLYSRAGLLDEAHEFIKKMPLKPNGIVWGALLGGCRVHKNTILAEEAIKHLHRLDPHNDGYYVILSNIYAESQRWEDVARVRKLMRDMGVKKTVALSSISVDGVTHEFVSGDLAHANTDEIEEEWEKLLPEIERLGYVPDPSVVLLDLDEDEKLKVLFRHSEKLALVYGLLNTPSRTPIRIMKNLRVCEDCHAAFKAISAVSDREIVVRDRNRFHCFKDGVCSCKDYW